MRTLIVLCAGNHTRGGIPLYLKEYSDGKIIAQKAIEGIFPEEYDKIIYVIKKIDSLRYKAKQILEEKLDNITILELESETSGPAETVYMAIKVGNIKGEIAIRDSHSYIDLEKSVSGNFVAGLDLNEYEGKIENYRKKSYIVLNEQKQILDIFEKRFCSDIMSVGLYGFSDANVFLMAYEHLNHESYPIKKIYVSHIISFLIGYKHWIFHYANTKDYKEWTTDSTWSFSKLIIADLDGTLFDTVEVNYLSYKEALNEFGYDIDYEYYKEYCNGRPYKDFITQIVNNDDAIANEVHIKKKEYYKKNIKHAKPNWALISLIQTMHGKAKTAIVTTASKKNTLELLREFDLAHIFDLILTQEDIAKTKPDPEGFLTAMNYFKIEPQKTIIFEDSDVGVKAAMASGAQCFITKGYN